MPHLKAGAKDIGEGFRRAWDELSNAFSQASDRISQQERATEENAAADTKK